MSFSNDLPPACKFGMLWWVCIFQIGQQLLQTWSNNVEHTVSNSVENCQTLSNNVEHSVSKSVENCQTLSNIAEHALSNKVEQKLSDNVKHWQTLSTNVEHASNNVEHTLMNTVQHFQAMSSTVEHKFSNNLTDITWSNTVEHCRTIVGEVYDQSTLVIDEIESVFGLFGECK